MFSNEKFRSLPALALMLVLMMLGSRALAQPESAEKESAEKIAERALAAYQRGNFGQAGTLFLEAFERSGEQTQLRNAAKSFEEAKALDKALSLWTKYSKDKRLTFEEQAEADAHIKLIMERQRSAKIQEDAKAARLEAAEAKQRMEAVVNAPPSTIPAYTMIGAGAAMGIAAVVLWFVSEKELRDLDEKLVPNEFGLISRIPRADAIRQLDAINAKRVATGVLASVGGAVGAAGILWRLLLPSEVPAPVLEVGGPRLFLGVSGAF